MRAGLRIVVLTCLLLAVGVVAVPRAVAAAAVAPPYSTTFTLQNGWTGSQYGTRAPGAFMADGIVHLVGSMATAGTDPHPFVLPPHLRPETDVYIGVDLCDAAYGRLYIQPSGVVTVQTATFAAAACFTSLDGAVYAPRAASFTPVAPIDGWTPAPYDTSGTAARVLGDVVYWKGAMATTGDNYAALRPPHRFRVVGPNAYPSVDQCNATKGFLMIQRNGLFAVGGPSGDAARCFTSMDGVSYVRTGDGATRLRMRNGWSGPRGTIVRPLGLVADGVVHLKGQIGTAGTNPQPFVLPPEFRPPAWVYVHTDTCGRDGRLIISPGGSVTAQGRAGFSDAACATSLDGVSYVL